MTARPLAANPRLLVVLSSLQFALFPMPIITLFWTDQIGMSIADVMALQAVFGLAVVSVYRVVLAASGVFGRSAQVPPEAVSRWSW